jgi:hypothetical protein
VGVYLVSVTADDWANDDLLLGARPELDRALEARGLSRCMGPSGDAMRILAAEIGLLAQLPASDRDGDLNTWIDDVEAGTAPAGEGDWRVDLDAAFYLAMFLRGAQFSIDHSCPMRVI